MTSKLTIYKRFTAMCLITADLNLLRDTLSILNSFGNLFQLTAPE